ncbi:MAG: Veg family protein [Lachnospiraceae bacterium]|nr:Veg family protein [Lachnospiraceae bacterium]
MKQPVCSVSTIKKTIISNVGKKVQIRTNLGRNRYDLSEGVIDKTYPCVFLVKLDNDSNDLAKTVSYSYTDVLTKEVELVF